MTQKLSDTDRDQALTDLKDRGWSLTDGRDAIQKTFKFKDFAETWGWMTRMAIEAEKMNHHPEWFNVYNRVSVVLTTHDADGLSELDIQLANKMDACSAPPAT